MKKLAILNAYDHRNRGDRAIIEAQMAWLERKVPGARFRVFSPAWESNEEVFGREVSVPPPIRTRRDRGALANGVLPLWATLRAAHGSDELLADECDGYFLCGGGYLYSSGAPLVSRQLWMHAGNSLLALSSGRPVMQFPQSWGPIRKASDRWICQRLAERLPCLAARGHESHELLEDWGFGAKTLEIPDIVLALGSLRPDWVRPRERGSGELGIAPIDFGFARKRSAADLERYLERLQQAAMAFTEGGGAGVVLFPQVQVTGSDEDLPVARELQGRLDAVGVPNRLMENLGWEEYFQELGSMSAFLGCRMHACIFALITGVPTVGLAYQPKFLATFGQLGMAERCHDIADFDGAEVGAQLCGLSEAGVDERKAVKVAIDEVAGEVLRKLDDCWERSGCQSLAAAAV